jgi:hypothetical protein
VRRKTIPRLSRRRPNLNHLLERNASIAWAIRMPMLIPSPSLSVLNSVSAYTVKMIHQHERGSRPAGEFEPQRLACNIRSVTSRRGSITLLWLHLSLALKFKETVSSSPSDQRTTLPSLRSCRSHGKNLLQSDSEKSCCRTEPSASIFDPSAPNGAVASSAPSHEAATGSTTS